MKLLLIRNLWGVEEPWEETFPRMKGAGYQGIELALPDSDSQHRLRERLEQFNLQYVAQIHTHGNTVEEHLTSLKRQMIEVKHLRPRQVVCYSGRDAWTDNESDRYIREALKIEEAVGLPMAHGIHRGRILFSPWRTSRLIDQNPNLKLCCDFSQWVVVTERLLDDLTEIVKKAAQRCLHVHGRVGYEEGPQAPDPRAAEYQRHLEAHERWWEIVWRAQLARGLEYSTFTPDYGPPPYLHTLPHTNVPVSSLSEICDWQAKREAERFARLFGTGNSQETTGSV